MIDGFRVFYPGSVFAFGYCWCLCVSVYLSAFKSQHTRDIWIIPFIFLNLDLCAACWAHYMCHYKLWPTSASHTVPYNKKNISYASKIFKMSGDHFDGLVLERRNSSALAIELCVRALTHRFMIDWSPHVMPLELEMHIGIIFSSFCSSITLLEIFCALP